MPDEPPEGERDQKKPPWPDRPKRDKKIWKAQKRKKKLQEKQGKWQYSKHRFGSRKMVDTNEGYGTGPNVMYGNVTGMLVQWLRDCVIDRGHGTVLDSRIGGTNVLRFERRCGASWWPHHKYPWYWCLGWLSAMYKFQVRGMALRWLQCFEKRMFWNSYHIPVIGWLLCQLIGGQI